MNEIKPLETLYAGRLFRSRTEARWAVFFDKMGFRWEYEKEGYDLYGIKYLPDFWLTDFNMFFEVKGKKPTEIELEKCQRLANKTKFKTLIGIGQPSEYGQIKVCFPKESDSSNFKDSLFAFYQDRCNTNEYWLVSTDGGFSIGPNTGDDHGKYPIVTKELLDALSAASAERFGT